MEFKIYSLCFLLCFIQLSREDTDQLSNNDVSDSTCTRDKCVKGNIVVNDVNKDKEHAEYYNRDANVIEDPSVSTDGDKEDYVEVINFEFPPLSRIDPGTVGDIVDLELEEGKFFKRITRAVQPPVFENSVTRLYVCPGVSMKVHKFPHHALPADEVLCQGHTINKIPNYLSDKECNMIISAALDAGLERSGVVGSDINEERQAVEDISQVSRVSEQTWLGQGSMPTDFWKRLVRRLSKLIQLPEGQIDVSEQMQVVSYVRGGHYHAHMDSSETKDKLHLPCCFQSPHCLDVDIYTEGYEQCCRICRYITVLYYLNDVDAGGETVFPLADMPDNIFEEKMTNKEAQSWYDLSHFCYNASLIIKPKRGTAIMWYNHFRDQDGYLGHVDERSYHGGCDILKGNKWIANNWISCPNFRDRTKPSLVY